MSKKTIRHSIPYKRHKDVVHINRKKDVIKNVYTDCEKEANKFKVIQQPHRLSKGKIHCSCPICSSKTNNLGWKHSDAKKLLYSDFADEDTFYGLESKCQKDHIVYSTNDDEEFMIDELFNILEKDSV